MPILLSTPWQMPETDPAVTQPRAKITLLSIYLEQKIIQLRVHYGDVVGGNWVVNPADIHENVEIVDTDFDAIMQELPEAGESVYDAVKRLSYDYIVANVPQLAGSVE